MKYNVEYVIRGTVVYTVDADSFEEAKEKGGSQFDVDDRLYELDLDGELYCIEKETSDGEFDTKYYM